MGFMVKNQLTRICWKNPTGSSFVERYILTYNVEGDDAYYEIDVIVNSNALEICTTTTDMDPYLTYLLYIRIFIGSERSPTSSFIAELAGDG